MHPTKLGLKAFCFYALLVCAFYAAPYLNLFFLLLAFLSVLGILSLYWSLMNLVGVRGEIHETQPFPAGASAVLHATLRCGRRKRHHLRLDLRLDGDRHTAGRVPHAAGEAEVNGTFPALPRGVHKITRASVSSMYPFGTVRVRTTLKAPAELVVYPAPTDLSHFRDRHEMLSDLGEPGGHLAMEMGPAGLREYKPGDEIRLVHWKASARRRGLVVKEYEGDTQPGLEVVLDLRAGKERLESALSLVTALAITCQENKDLITLTTQDHRGTYGKGHRGINELWTYLAKAQQLPAYGPPPPKASPGVLHLPKALEVAAP